jgi:DNA-binding MarR family transcriptional regulator
VRPFNKAERYVLRYLKDKNLATVNDIMDHADACAPGTARKAVYTLSDKNYIARQDIGLQGTEATYGLTDAGREQSDQV